MRKSEHTELATLSRLAVYTSLNGLHNLTYGNAAKAAHLSKGALQRLFPDSESMQLAVIRHSAQLLNQHVFGYDRIDLSSMQAYLERWSAWICGDSGLPGGCVLLAVLGSRGFSAAVAAQANSSLREFLERLWSLQDQPINSARWFAAAFALHAVSPLINLSEAEKSNWWQEFSASAGLA